MNNIYNAIISLIIELFGTTDYMPYINSDGNSITPIFKGYDNKLVPPKTSNYVIITSERDKNMSLKWEPIYDNTTNQNTYMTLASTLFHIDLYGDNAEDNARGLNVICQNGYANQYWYMNNMGTSIHEVKDPINLSDIFGRDMYNKRFRLDMKVFNNIIQTLTIPYFNSANVNLQWIDNTK